MPKSVGAGGDFGQSSHWSSTPVVAFDCQSMTSYYYYYEVRTHSTHTDRKTDKQTDIE